jgi:hypothetical protein
MMKASITPALVNSSVVSFGTLATTQPLAFRSGNHRANELETIPTKSPQSTRTLCLQRLLPIRMGTGFQHEDRDRGRGDDGGQENLDGVYGAGEETGKAGGQTLQSMHSKILS